MGLPTRSAPVACELATGACSTDDDCPADQACTCADAAGPARCVPAECRLDGDCAEGWCLPERAACVTSDDAEDLFVVGLRCATPDDVCRDDGACGGPRAFCLYAEGRFTCTQPSLGSTCEG